MQSPFKYNYMIKEYGIPCNVQHQMTSKRCSCERAKWAEMMKEMSMLQFELSLKSVWKDVHENIFSFKLEVGFHSFVLPNHLEKNGRFLHLKNWNGILSFWWSEFPLFDALVSLVHLYHGYFRRSCSLLVSIKDLV